MKQKKKEIGGKGIDSNYSEVVTPMENKHLHKKCVALAKIRNFHRIY